MQTAPKTLTDIVAEAQALATVAEDQFEANLATLVADLQALAAAPAASAPVVTNVVVNFSDNTSKQFDPKA